MIPALACVILPLLGGCSDFVRDTPGIAQVVQQRSKYRGKSISVTGRVQKLDQWTSKLGRPEEIFSVCQDSCIRVYILAHSPIHNGQLVTVRGTYYDVYRAGRETFHNEIEGTEVLPRE